MQINSQKRISVIQQRQTWRLFHSFNLKEQRIGVKPFVRKSNEFSNISTESGSSYHTRGTVRNQQREF